MTTNAQQMQECLFGAALVKLLNHRDENAGNKQLIKSIVDKVMRSIMGKADSYKAIVGRAREDSAGSRVAAAVMPMRSQKQRRAAKASSEVRTNTVHAAAALQGRASLGYTGKERLRARLPQELHLHYDRSIHIESAKPKMRKAAPEKLTKLKKQVDKMRRDTGKKSLVAMSIEGAGLLG